VKNYKGQIKALWIALIFVFIIALVGWFLPSQQPKEVPKVSFKQGDVLRVEEDNCKGCTSACYVFVVFADQQVGPGDHLIGESIKGTDFVLNSVDTSYYAGHIVNNMDEINWPPVKYEILFNENTDYYKDGLGGS